MTESKTVSNAVVATKRRRRQCSLPMPTAENSADGTYQFRVAETFWTDLPKGAIFSMNKDGSFPFFKLSKSSYQNLRTLEVATNVQGNSKVFRVFL